MPDVNNFSFIYSQVCNDMIQNLLATPQMTRILLKISFSSQHPKLFSETKIVSILYPGLVFDIWYTWTTWCAKLCTTKRLMWNRCMWIRGRTNLSDRFACQRSSFFITVHRRAPNERNIFKFGKDSVAYWVTCVNGLLRLITKYGVKGSQNILPVSEGLYLGGPIRNW